MKNFIIIGLKSIILLSFIILSCKNAKIKEANTKDLDLMKDSTDIKILVDTLLCNGLDFPVGDKNGNGPYISLVDGKKYNSWFYSVGFCEKYSLGIHPGEDWGGSGSPEADFNQPVYAIGKGIVLAAKDYQEPWGNIVFIQHFYKINNKIDTVFSLYAHLNKMYVQKNQIVNGREKIGTIGTGGVYKPHLHFEIRKNLMKYFDVDFWPSGSGYTKKDIIEMYESPSAFIQKHRKLRIN